MERMFPVLVMGAPALFFLQPYMVGMMFHHYLSRHAARVFGWFVVFFISILLGFLNIVNAAQSHGYWDPSLLDYWRLSWIVMLIQPILWVLLWYALWKSKIATGWRTVAIAAFFACLPLLTVTFLYYTLGFLRHDFLN